MKSNILRKKIRERNRKRKKRIFSFIYIFLILVLSLYGYNYYHDKNITTGKDNGIVESITSVVNPENKKKIIAIDDTKLALISQILAETPGNKTAVHIVDINSNKEYHLGSTDAFVGASTTKLLSGICYLKKVEKGTLNPSKYLGAYTGSFQLKQLINQSNDDSWELINSAIGTGYLDSCAAEIGAPSFQYYGNTVLPSEMTKVLSNLVSYKLLTKENTDLLLSYMQNTNEERMIPASIPEGYTAFHKYGILSNGNLHDVGIVSGNGQKFIIAVYTKGKNLGDSELTNRLAYIKKIIEKIFS